MTRWLVVLGALVAGCGGGDGAEANPPVPDSVDAGPAVDAGMVCVQGAACSSTLKGETPIVGYYEACTTLGPVELVPETWAFDAGPRFDIVLSSNDDAGRVTWTLCSGN